MRHRPARLDDLPAVIGFVQNRDELFNAYPKARWPFDVEQLAAALAERSASTLALLDERPAAFANFYQCEPGAYCALGNMMVAPWARSRGTARYLIGVMEDLARHDYAARVMKISCFNGNAGGLLLYSSLGYRPTGIVERQAPDGQRVALVQMEKALEPS